MTVKQPEKSRTRLHPRNKNREKYNLPALIAEIPALKHHVILNKLGEDSINFSNPKAVKLLNKALLSHYYGIKNWDFPDENLCPPIPGRADYIHYMADILSENNFGKLPNGDKINCLDIGVGANCIYPIIGVTEYSWNFIGSDIDQKSILTAQHIIDSNPTLFEKIQLKLQTKPRSIFKGIISGKDQVDLIISNPPFHSSVEEAQKGTQRKIKNLSGKKEKSPQRNFAGISNELIYEGGERQFIQNMITESKLFSRNCFWFSTLVSKQSNLKGIHKSLKSAEAKQVKTIPMGTGNKSSRIVAWTFLSTEEQKAWRTARW